VPEKRQPASQVHIDQTPAAVLARVHRHVPPDEAPALLRKRFQVVNLWRPISHPAYDWPLALCDYQSVDAARDVVPITLKVRPAPRYQTIRVDCAAVVSGP
jgi:hypothetical protein